MTTNQANAASAGITYAPLSDAENERAVERIETAERENPICLCGVSMVAVAHDGAVWLECSDQNRKRAGIGGFLARIGGFGHSRRLIMKLPTIERAA